MYTPNYNNAMMQNEPQEAGSMGSLIGIILIIAIIVLGGIYFWGKKTSNQVPTDANAVTADTQTLENDLNSVDTTGGADVSAIDQKTVGN